MGYDIYIGNTIMEPVEQYDDEEVIVTPYARTTKGQICYYKPVVRKTERSPAAPIFPEDEMTGNGSSRHPGYTPWSNFCKMAGLTDLFFNDEYGLMREHPGHAELRLEHAQAIDSALKAYNAKYPGAIPRFGDGATPADAHLARLIWLDWWVKWALAHCEHPGIYNF